MSFILELDDLPLIEQVTKNGRHVDQLRVFKTKEEVAAKLITVAALHPNWHLNFLEAPYNLSITPDWFATGARKARRVSSSTSNKDEVIDEPTDDQALPTDL